MSLIIMIIFYFICLIILVYKSYKKIKMDIYDISLALKYGIKNNETKVKKVIKKKSEE